MEAFIGSDVIDSLGGLGSVRVPTPVPRSRGGGSAKHAQAFKMAAGTLSRLPIMATRAFKHLRQSSAVSVMHGLPSYSW